MLQHGAASVADHLRVRPACCPVVVQEQVTIGGDAPLAIEGPVSVKSIAGAVTVNADARVSGVEGQVSVTADDPLAMRADVSVDNKVTIGGKVDFRAR